MHSKLVAGRYATVRELGRGGMGVVWLAEDRVIGRRVALKELRNTDRERVLREARTAGRVDSPAVVAVHDVVSEHGITYIVMELVEAPTLADLMRNGPLPVERVSAIGLEVVRALETAHAAGVVHRDVKPGNIMVLPDGRVKLADFGIARALDDPGPTVTGGVMGSPGYPAPELFAGQAPSPATDLWSLGATLFHAAEGRSPFQRDSTAATRHAILHDEPVLTRCTGPLATVVKGLLTRTNRLDAAQVRGLLAGAGGGRPRAAEPDTVIIEAPTSLMARIDTGAGWGAAPRKSRRRIVVPAVGAVVVTAVALTAALVLIPEGERGRASAALTESSHTTRTTTQAAPSSAPPSTTITTTTEAAPPVTTTPATPPRQTAALTRFRNAEGWHYTGSTMLVTPDGFGPEGGMGNLAINAEPDTSPLYSCQIKDTQDRMTSLSPICEGQTVYGLLGHVFTKQPADAAAVPIYRCNMGGHHFESLSPDCEGKTVEFQIGWVLA